MTHHAVIFMMGMVAMVFGSHTVEAATICTGSSENLKCFEQHFDELYAKDYSHFWAILNKSSVEAKQCRSIKKTAEFLSLVRLKSNNAEFKEFFAQTTENLCMSSPHCFKRASKLLDKESQKNLAAMFNTPLYVDREDLHKAGCIDEKQITKINGVSVD